MSKPAAIRTQHEGAGHATEGVPYHSPKMDGSSPRHRRVAAALTALITLAGAANLPGQGDLRGQERVHITRARFVPDASRPGDRVLLEVSGDIDPGYHVYGAKETMGLPIALVLDDVGGLTAVGQPDIPVGEPHVAFGETSFWIRDTVKLTQSLMVPSGAKAGTIEVKGRLRYTACTEDFCDPEAETPFSARLTVSDAPGPHVQLPKVDRGLFGATKLSVEPSLAPDPARPGERVEITLRAQVIPGWHVYGAKEATGAPVSFELTGNHGLGDAGPLVVPDGEPHEMLGELTYWLAGEFTMSRTWTVPESAKPGTVELNGRVLYVACDEKSCDPAAEQPFSVALTIEAGAARAAHAPATTIDSGIPNRGSEREGAEAGRDGGPVISGAPVGADSGLLALLLAAVTAGLAALVMPCTYPMIPITFSFFTKQAERRGGSVLPLALIYGIGIVAIFVAIGLVIGPAIVPFATHWVTNLVIGVVFAFFALALFGVVELRPPAFLMDLGSSASSRGGYLGVFLMGATLVIATFACTVPFVGFLLGVGAQGGVGRVAIGMGTFGATMAIPFVLLSLLPGRMQALPRAGEWMHVVKVYLGFVELAAALKFLSNVDLVLGWQLLPRELFLMLWCGIFLVAGMFLLGTFRLAGETHAEISAARMMAALTTILFGLYFLFGALGNRLDDVLEPLVPNYSNRIGAAASGAVGTATHEIVVDDYEAAAARARQTDKLLLVNYTGKT